MTLLEKASNIAVILAALAITSTVAYDRVVRPSQARATAADFSAKYLGKKMPVNGSYVGSSTVFLIVSRNCHFCEESMPFYRRVAAIRTASKGRLRLMALVPKASESESEATARFREQGVSLDAVQAISFSAIGVVGTPTFVLAGNDGHVAAAWTGKLPQEKEAQVVERIFAECKGCAREDNLRN